MTSARRLGPFNLAALAAGFALLYLPILALAVYSFNDGRMVAVWSGWSLRWYRSLIDNRLMLDSARVTLAAGAVSATLALVAGTAAALVLARAGRFLGRSAFAGLVYVPLVMPEVIIGISLLLLFVQLDLDRGFPTLVVAHASFSAAFVTVVVHSRLVTVDRSIEEAALDLGSPPAKTFFLVTVPMIAPAMAAAWLLAFTLSLDDLVIASFATGPGATTLPMRVYSQVRLGVTPEINAISTLFIAAVAGVVALASLVNKGLLFGRK
ncbi:MAG: ABC transporter permease subunit [Alphaproteobacteria bacterium]|nr:ABC transporter permease subunit [Alphaproteobacteria bacterium]